MFLPKIKQSNSRKAVTNAKPNLIAERERERVKERKKEKERERKKDVH